MNTSARPSVNVRNRTQTFTPVCASLQVVTRSGFPSGRFAIFPKIPDLSANIRVARSTKSGFATAAVKFADAAFRARVRFLGSPLARLRARLFFGARS
jgi:hypothetical protein